MNIRILLSVIALSVVFFACERDDSTAPVITVTPGGPQVFVKIDDVASFNVNIESENRLSLFQVKTKLADQFETVAYDSILSTKNANFNYEFRVPDSYADQEEGVIFTFTAIDEEGESGRSLRRVIGFREETKLEESAGHIIYSKWSKKADAFDIQTLQPQFASLAASNLLDIIDNDIDALDHKMDLQWASESNVKFVKFNGFDYANATDISTKKAFESGQQFPIINDLTKNDIIIARYDSIADLYAAIRLTNIVDTDSTNNDRYEFNIKAITEK